MKNLQGDIKSGTFKQAYLLYGPEAYLRQQYKQNLVKALNPEEDTMNFTRFEGDAVDVRALIDLCETMPFFADRRIVLLEDTGLFKSKGDKGKSDALTEYMKTLPEYLYLLFVESEADKRTRMYKAVQAVGRAVEFKFQDAKTLMRWAAGFLGKNGRKIKEADVELLLEKTGTDMGNLRMELEKLLGYTQGRDVVTRQDIEAVCVTTIQNKIFDMLRAVTNQDTRRALELYYDLLSLKEPPMKILFLLAKEYRRLYLIKQLSQEGLPREVIAQKLEVRDFVVRNLAACARSYTLQQLEGAIADFVDAEEAVKTGHLQDVLSVELLIIKYSGGAAH